MNILLSSVGRRPYLVRWFREALDANGVDGKVIVADLDELSPARSVSDEFWPAPRVGDPGYRSWLEDLVTERSIDMGVSVNDFELSRWSLLPRGGKLDALLRLDPRVQQLVEDKYQTGDLLRDFGVRTPETWLGGEAVAVAVSGRKYVTKGRFGSSSRGLRFAEGVDLVEAVTSAAHEVTTPQGQSALLQDEVDPAQYVIVQEEVFGDEYGLDVVCDLAGNFAGVLARRKISMRAGETDRAESVDPGQFEEIARRIAAAIPHPGTMDVDLIVDARGDAHVFDINPRFGGGAPFSHLAGARIPHAYVAWAAGKPVKEEWLKCRPCVIGGKYVDVMAIKPNRHEN